MLDSGGQKGLVSMIRQPRRWPGYVIAAVGIVFVLKYPATAAGLVKGVADFVEWSAARAHDFTSAFH
jgi:hypothetical protein